MQPGRTIVPVSGSSRDGQPLSRSRAVAPDLAPWISRVFATVVDAPADHTVSCSLLNDTAFVRLLLAGKWSAETADGTVRYEGAALFFGPQSRAMPVSVEGPFATIGFGLRPGACHALGGPDVSSMLDRIAPLDDFGLSPAAELLDGFEISDRAIERTLLQLEDWARSMIAAKGAKPPDPLLARFDRAAFLDPNLSIADFAAGQGIEQRRLERLVRRGFGLTPKQVLRRARALDMASNLRGFAAPDEAEALALRYYDQSHMTREFHHFFGQTPAQFVAQPQPILTLGLEARQARRLEELERIDPSDPRPWQDS